MRIWPVVLTGLVIVFLSLGGGWAMAQTWAPHGQPANDLMAQASIPQNLPPVIPDNPRSVDPIATRYLPGFESYIETCTGCHIALPPEVLPLDSWQEILRRPDVHYGVSIPNINRLTQLLIWDYVSTFSRPLPPNNPVPLYAEKSRFFKALHPRVPMPEEVTSKTCITCHPGAEVFDFITLSPEWQDAP
jgi:hypothetical protein